MSTASIQLTSTYYTHTSGTKFYRFIVANIKKSDGRNPVLVLKNWGKVGATGQFQFDEYGSLDSFNRFVTTKTKRGYSFAEKELNMLVVSKKNLCDGLSMILTPNFSSGALAEFVNSDQFEKVWGTSTVDVAEPVEAVESRVDRGEIWGMFS